jgi:hypothetical protein
MSDRERTEARSPVRHRLNESEIVPRKIASLALIAASSASTTGLTAFAKEIPARKPTKIITKSERIKYAARYSL